MTCVIPSSDLTGGPRMRSQRNESGCLKLEIQRGESPVMLLPGSQGSGPAGVQGPASPEDLRTACWAGGTGRGLDEDEVPLLSGSATLWEPRGMGLWLGVGKAAFRDTEEGPGWPQSHVPAGL